MTEGRTTQVSIRLTEDERERIRGNAKRSHMKEAAYIRKVVLGQKDTTLPEDAEALLRQFLEANLNVGKEINRTARCCRERGSYSQEQYSELTESLERINCNYEKLYERITEVINRNGDHEAAPPEGEQKRESCAASDQ